MKRVWKLCLMAAAMMSLTAVAAHAWVIHGRVVCGETGEGVEGVVVNVVSTCGDVTFSGSNTSNADGGYVVYLPDGPCCYEASLVLGAGQSAIDPADGTFDFCVSEGNEEVIKHFSILTPDCAQEEGACWLTAGGAKFSSLTGTLLGEHGPQHSWGGNVYPGCSSTAGDGGNWNHIAHALKLHFQGREIVVERCGNVAGIPPGSDSPDTPFNYIEFHGVGTLKGIKGNKVDHGTVYFWAHCEDRNEPGSHGQRDGAYKDRYFLHVFSNLADPNGSTLLLIDVDGNPATVDPVTITDGNMQIHISSCDDPEIGITRAREAESLDRAQAGEPATWGKLKTIYRK